MELTAKIIFFAAFISMILWILKIILTLSSTESRVKIIMGAEVTIGIGVPLILFIIMAITAGIAWG